MTAAPPLTWLALGDSYTIGEGLPLYHNYPYQAVQLLRNAGITCYAPEIIARTGWTTDELQQAIDQTTLQPVYELVTLLIGVNNQYRGYPADEYKVDFERLLQQGLALSGQRPERVLVLSIPDWGATPFAEQQNRSATASAAIELFNQHNRSLARRYRTGYIDITPGSRLAATHPSLLAPDLLHYSAVEYARWARQLVHHILAAI